MKKIFLVGVMASAFALSGCQFSGNTLIKHETALTIDQKIQDGVTNKQQVKAVYGDPGAVNYTDNGHEVWKYTFSSLYSDGVNFLPIVNMFRHGVHGTTKTLLIIFNEDRVWHHTWSESQVAGSNTLSGPMGVSVDGKW